MSRLTFYDGQGTDHILGERDDVLLLQGQSGFGAPEVSLVTSAVPRRHGETYRGHLYGPRGLAIPMMLQATNPVQMEALRDEVMGWFNPLRGRGTLRYERDNGSVREIRCILSGGLSMASSETADVGQPLVVQLTAHDPYWYDPNWQSVETSLTTGTATLNTPFSSPLFTSDYFVPYGLAVNNLGTADAYPEFSLVGAYADPTIENITTGKKLVISGLTVPAGAALHVVMDPGRREVTLVSGTYTQNLAVNPNFQAGTAGWTDYGSADVTHVAGDSAYNDQAAGAAYGGSCMEISSPAATGDRPGCYVSCPVGTVSGRQYRVLFNAKRISGGSVVRYALGPTTWSEVTITSSWARYSGVVTAGDPGSLQFTGKTSSVFRIDGLMIVDPSADTTYIDGNQTGCTWDGVPYRSASSRWGLYPQNALRWMQGGSEFWPLVPGVNQIRITTTSVGGAPKARIAFRRRYIGV